VCATMWSTFFVVTGGFNRAGPAIASSRQYETYDLAAGTSSVYLPMLNLRAWHAAEAIAGTAVFVFGGFNISTNVPILLNEKITFSGTLASFGSLRVPRGRLASALVNGTKIYAIGGQNTSHVALGTVEFSNNGGGWTIVSFSLQTPRHSAKAAAVGNRVYVVGGFDINNVMLPSVECSDMASPWTNVAPLPAARASHAASAFLGLLYIMGGQNSTLDIVSDVFIYNPTNDTWSVGPSLAQASMDACSVVMP
jgi:N-acetylneuraminic acid mutarotase